MPSGVPLRIGTRSSPLARWQAEFVASELKKAGVATELVLISTQGDQQRENPIGSLGTQGVFTKEIQRALLRDEIEVAVHSLKDLPTAPVPGIRLVVVPCRGPFQDVLVTPDHISLEELPSGARIGTGSLRRQAQLLHIRPDLQVGDVRGNVETRLAKLASGKFDGLLLAEAGLRRLEMHDAVGHVLPVDMMMPAVGQGALGLEIRSDDSGTADRIMALDDARSHAAVLAERALLAGLRGGCLAPVGAHAEISEGGMCNLHAVVLDRFGKHSLRDEHSGPSENAAAIGSELAESLLGQGAAQLIAETRGSA